MSCLPAYAIPCLFWVRRWQLVLWYHTKAIVVTCGKREHWLLGDCAHLHWPRVRGVLHLWAGLATTSTSTQDKWKMLPYISSADTRALFTECWQWPTDGLFRDGLITLWLQTSSPFKAAYTPHYSLATWMMLTQHVETLRRAYTSPYYYEVAGKNVWQTVIIIHIRP